MTNRHYSVKSAFFTAIAAAALAFALLASAGAQQPSADDGSAQPFGAQGNGDGSASAAPTTLTFDLNACQNVGPGLYQCPPTYRAACDPTVNRGDFVCLRVDQNSVLIRQGMP